MTSRRTFLAMGSVMGLGLVGAIDPLRARTASSGKGLSGVPLELAGDWDESPRQAVRSVLVRVRKVCLRGLKLFSDRQPEKLRVENHPAGSPAIWLQSEQPGTAWIIVNIAPRAWIQLAYQFGHELGHVFCNSWMHSAQPGPPTQWLEEAMVEAFSVRGLGLLADSWEKKPPFAGDHGFAEAIRKYRKNLIERYGDEEGTDIASWFRSRRSELESGRSARKDPAVLAILALLESERACVEDMGGVNRWPERAQVPLEDYLSKWSASCSEVGAPGRLPVKLRDLFQIG